MYLILRIVQIVPISATAGESLVRNQVNEMIISEHDIKKNKVHAQTSRFQLTTVSFHRHLHRCPFPDNF